MLLTENEFPISIRSIKDDYIVFTSKGRSILKISKTGWCKFTPNPSLTRFCTSPCYEEITYKDAIVGGNIMSKNQCPKKMSNIVYTMMAVGILDSFQELEYTRVLLQIGSITK